MITSFPIPENDENLYSLLMRYHILSGNKDLKTTVKELTGTSRVFDLRTITSPLPMTFSHLANKISPLCSLHAAEILERLTIFPFFRSFINFESYTKMAETILSGSSKNDKAASLFGLSKKKHRVRGPMRFCYNCACQDFENFGFTYWRRSHQLPGVSACNIHGTKLIFEEEKTYMYSPPTDKMLPWLDCNQDGSNKVHLPTVASTQENNYAYWSHKFLFSENVGYGPNILRSVFRDRLTEKEYIYGTRSVNMKQLRADLIEFHGMSYLISMNADHLPLSGGSNWLRQLINKSKRDTYFCAVYNILLISFLFDSYDEFHNACFKAKEIAENPRLDSVYTTNNEIKETAHRLLKSGIKQSVIKEQLNISNIKLSNILIDSKCEEDHNYKKIIQTKWRNRILDKISICQNATRTYLWRANDTQTAMRWLLANDREWLDKTINIFPSRASIIEQEKKDKLDKLLAAQIHDIVCRLEAKVGRPEKITVTAIGRELNIKRFNRKLEYLPTTRKLVNELIDSKESVDLKRLEWAIKYVKSEGLPPNITTINSIAIFVRPAVSQNAIDLAKRRLLTDF